MCNPVRVSAAVHPGPVCCSSAAANEYKRCGGRVGFRKLPEAPRGYGTDLGVGRRCEARRRRDEAAARGQKK
jgi:hypothetical protein